MVMLARELAAGASRFEPEQWARERGLGRYFGSSLKGEADIDWDDPEAREKLLDSVVADADRLL
jgi:type 1 glutamine amidotransferase